MKLAVLVGLLLSVSVTTAQEMETIGLEELTDLIESKSEKLKIINFWASWCGPCIKEMPYLDEMGRSKRAEVHFVSLDFIQDKAKAGKVLAKKEIISNAYLLNETDADKYILSISETWSGAIPATLIITPSGKRFFYEKAFEKAELEEIVQNLTTK